MQPESGDVMTRPSAVHFGHPGTHGLCDGGAITQAWHEVARRAWLLSIPGWVDPGWFTAPIRPEVRALLDLRPGPELLTALAGLGRTLDCPADHSGELAPWEQPDGLPNLGRAGSPCACRLVMVAAWSAMTAWVEVQHTRHVVAAARQEPVRPRPVDGRPVVVDPAVDEIATTLRMSGDSARGRIAAARQLCEQPVLLDLIEEGFCSAWTARLLMQDLRDVAACDAATVIDTVADRVRRRGAAGVRPWTGSEIRQCARRAAVRHGVDSSEARRRARAGRCVTLIDDPNGASRLVARIGSADAHRIRRRLTAIAKGLLSDSAGTDARTLDQVRADLLVDLLLGGGQRPPGAATEEVAVVVDLPTLMGLTEASAQMPGYGPVPADIARELAADAHWRMWITSADKGVVVATSPGTYRPTAAVARLVRAREPFCRMPGCRRRSQGCDLDHVIPWPRGSTTPANLGPLCRRHHNLKTHYGWELSPTPAQGGDPDDRAPTGWSWRSPSGLSWAEESDRSDDGYGG